MWILKSEGTKYNFTYFHSLKKIIQWILHFPCEPKTDCLKVYKLLKPNNIKLTILNLKTEA